MKYYIGVADFLLKVTQTPAKWVLQPLIEGIPWRGLVLFSGKAYIGTTTLLTTHLHEALVVLPVFDFDRGTFTLRGVGPVNYGLTLHSDSDGNYVSIEEILPENKDPVYQHWSLKDSGITFSAVITIDMIKKGLKIFGWALSVPQRQELADKFKPLDYNYVTTHESLMSTQNDHWITVGSVLGKIIAGLIGYLISGERAESYLSDIGEQAGAYIGGNLVSVTPNLDQNVYNRAMKNVIYLLSYFKFTPTGGPYNNQALWDNIISWASFPMIGDDDLPLAGCVLPPDGSNKFSTWIPSLDKIIGFPVDDEVYPPLRGIYGGRNLYMLLFVIVQTVTGYQIRIHPKWSVNTPGMPAVRVHSQLTDGSSLWACVEGAGTDHMKVFAAGVLYLIADDGKPGAGTLLGMTAESDQYFEQSE